MKFKPVIFPELLKFSHIFSTKYFGDHLNRKKKLFSVVFPMFEPTEEGSAQGSVMSPMLANIYMHHVLTLWFKLVVQREMQGECFHVNFADDFVAGFQYKSEAERYYKELKERMEKFEQKVRAYKNWIYDNRNRPMREIIKELNVKLIGHYRYYGVTWNLHSTLTKWLMRIVILL